MKWTCAFPHFGLAKGVLKLNLRYGGGGVGGLTTGKIRRMLCISLSFTQSLHNTSAHSRITDVIRAGFVFVLGLGDRISLCGPGWPSTQQITSYFTSQVVGPKVELDVWTTSPGFDRNDDLVIWATIISAFCLYTCTVDAVGWASEVAPPTDLAPILAQRKAMNVWAKILGSSHSL